MFELNKDYLIKDLLSDEGVAVDWNTADSALTEFRNAKDEYDEVTFEYTSVYSGLCVYRCAFNADPRSTVIIGRCKEDNGLVVLVNNKRLYGTYNSYDYEYDMSFYCTCDSIENLANNYDVSEHPADIGVDPESFPQVQEFRTVQDSLFLIRGSGSTLKENDVLLLNKNIVHLFVCDEGDHEHVVYSGKYSLCGVPVESKKRECWVFPFLKMQDKYYTPINLFPIRWNDHFKKVLFPNLYTLSKYPETAYVRVADEDTEDSESEYVTLELYTDQMIDINRRFFVERKPDKEDWVDYVYKPYFFSIVVKRSEINIKKGEIRLIRLKKMSDEPVTGDYCQAVLFNAASEAEGRGVDIKLENITVSQDIEDALKMTDAEVDLELNNVNKTSYPNIDNRLKSVFDDIFHNASKFEIDIHTVGNANMIECRNDRNVSFFFDFGIPNNPNLRKAFDSIGQVKAYYSFINDNPRINDTKYFILSHWHGDHFSGLYCVSDDFWKKDHLFIAPEMVSNEISVGYHKRLVAFMIRKGLLIIIPKDYNNQLVYDSNNGCRIMKGKGYKIKRNGTRVEDPNNSSLVIQLKNTLMSGDCDCVCWPDDYGKDNGRYKIFKQIVGPHHCGEDSITADFVNSDLCNVSDQDTVVYFCVGANTYNHPYSDQYEFVRNNITGNIVMTNKDYDTDEVVNELNPVVIRIVD